jgi:DNA-binding GntR family transcriptional regulator
MVSKYIDRSCAGGNADGRRCLYWEETVFPAARSPGGVVSDSAEVRRRPHLGDDAAAYLRGMIMSGQLRAGEIVQPPAIGEAIGISATPVREALQTLRVEGFVELVPRRGFQVASITGKDIRDMFIAYALIAGELAARASQVASEDQLNELEALHYELMAAARRGDISVVEAKNFAFHASTPR